LGFISEAKGVITGGSLEKIEPYERMSALVEIEYILVLPWLKKSGKY